MMKESRSDIQPEQGRMPKREGIMNNDKLTEAVRHILGLPSHILQPYASFNISRYNAMLINGDYKCMHASIQSLNAQES